jgi:hypothetical protein
MASAPLRRCWRELAKIHTRATEPCPRGLPSAAPRLKFAHALLQECRESGLPEQALEDYASLLEAVREKRHLTIDWRGAMMTQEELIDATARRVGLVAPAIMNNEWRTKKL